MSTPPAGGPGPGTFSGIDPGRLKGMIDSLAGAAHVLTSANGWNGEFSRLGVDTGGLTRLVGVGKWVEQQLPSLKRRFDLALAIERNGSQPGHKLVQVPDNFLSLQEAQRIGQQLADQLNKVDHTNEAGATEIHRIAGELARYKDDPELLAAFFARLGPNRLTTLPLFMQQSGSGTAKEDLQTFSRALGTATSAQYLATPGFEQVEQTMLRHSENPGDNWGRLALMQYGNFPTEFLKTAAKNLALDQFAKDPKSGTDWRGGMSTAPAYGLSEDNLALALNLLGKDPVAARDVLGGMNAGDYRKTFDVFLGYAKSYGSGDDVAAGLGRAIEAGSGVGFEQPGQHSAPSAQFALLAMTYMGGKGKDVPWSMKGSMANLGASYLHELTTGARDDDAPYRQSGMNKPPNWTDIPGVTPSFYLSPQDTDRFMTTFAGSQPATDAFDTAAGLFREQVIRAAAKTDADAVRAGKADPQQMSRAASVFGKLAGAEYRAEVAAGKDMDAQSKAWRTGLKDVVTFGLGEMTLTNQLLNYGWKLTKQFPIGKNLGKWAEGDGSQEQQAIQAFQSYDRMQRFRMTQYLYESGYPVQPPPPKEVLNADGSVKSFEQLQQEAVREAGGRDPNAVFQQKLKALTDWADSTAGQDGDRFDNKIDDAAERGRITGAVTAPEAPAN
ncbi:hypothetical protein FM076_27490 [Streptomyces albus subsp. chlorinus]|uniref:hypothetical protein n=1 Tax=Streptomyces albus TaxID=1888 RepID=UPI00156E064E|nr:hypothetical protein [Streptomyces albus]NSC24697.1 hypothetical protein [Streptomyces albus subsp. chlorinus]